MMVDDAHSSGVLGRGGRGTVDHLGCHGRVHIQVGTLSKAIGAMGGYVCGSRELIDFLYHPRAPLPLFYWPSALRGGQLPGRIYSAGFPGRRKADQEALGQHEILPAPPEEARLSSTGATQTPITPIHVGDAAKAFEFSRRFLMPACSPRRSDSPPWPKARPASAPSLVPLISASTS